MTTLFSKIIRGEIPAEKVDETEHELAFLDLYPLSEGHTLVVPKQEVALLDDLEAERAQSLILTVQRVARGVGRALGTPAYNIALNNGAAAGQEIPHVHFHVIPRWAGRRRERLEPSPEQLAATARRIREALRSLDAS